LIVVFYIGTHSKKSGIIRPRNPFAQDTTQLDYEFDSDEEWEGEDIDAESLGDSEEEEEDSEADELVSNKLFH
jgi:chromatin assembly factor 1 subunit A